MFSLFFLKFIRLLEPMGYEVISPRLLLIILLYGAIGWNSFSPELAAEPERGV